MATNDPRVDQPLADQKLLAEIEKLRTENKKLQESAWRSPAVLIAAGGLVLSLFGNIAQYRYASNATAASARQIELAESRWGEERQKLRAELEVLQARAKNVAEERSGVQEELEKVNKDIVVWDSALTKDNIDLMLLKAKLSQYEASNRPEMAAATRKNIVLQQDMIRLKTEEKNAAVARRSELEKRLGSSR
jgi:chromosome segregation ATPase